MNRKISLFAVIVVLVMLCAACSASADQDSVYPPRAGAEVAAIFAAPDIQPYTEEDGKQEKLDSILVFYTDGCFEQFAELGGNQMSQCDCHTDSWQHDGIRIIDATK